MKKRVLSLMLTVMLVVAVLPLGALKVDAVQYTQCTRDEALAWARHHADNRTAFDIDGVYDVQCSDFGTAYLNYIISGDYRVNHPYNTYNGNYYLNLDYPDGWRKIYNTPEFIPDPGDIMIWANGDYGHIAVAEEGCTVDVCYLIQQNGNGNIPTDYATWNYVDFLGVIRPAWKTASTPPQIDTSYAGYYECTADPNLFIRDGDNTGCTELGSIPLGATVYVEGITPNNWAKLSYDGLTGYSSMDYLKKITHKVTFKDYNGTVLKTQTVNHKADAAPPAASRTGYSFKGWSGSYTDVTSDRTVTATYTANSYENTISHWLWGFENGDSLTMGDAANTPGTAVKLDTATFSATYDTTITLDSSRCVTPPNGCKIGQRTVQTDVYASRDTYCSVFGNQNFPYQYKYQSCGLSIEYEYEPITYTISYKGLEGAAHSNPATYNVFYGVTLSAPAAREGYNFDGWYIGSTKVTGINEGKNARFASVDAMKNELAGRQTGNVVLEARWTPTVKPGDIDNNSTVEGSDYVLIKLVLRGVRELDESGRIAADCNKDGVISALDCILLAALIKQ